VHTHNLMGLGFLIPALLRRRKVRHVHTVHDVQLLHPSGLLPPTGQVKGIARVPQAAYVALMRVLFGSTDTVIFPSAYLRDRHREKGFFPRSRVEIVRNPAPDVSLAARAVPAAPSFLFVGQLERHKGVDLLLDAWARWHDKGTASLEIAGAGAMDADVRASAAATPGVRVLGKLANDAVLEALSRSAYLVFPSIVIENAPTAIMESLSRGTPVVAASVGGVPEIVVEGETGFLFKPGDVDACVEALRRAAASMPDWSAYFERCMKAAQSMSRAKHLERLMAAYARKRTPAS
jgi:glycosyltransferase involved in cell wall biosynthesis